MASVNLENSALHRSIFQNGKWGQERQALTGTKTLSSASVVMHLLDANGADRTVLLPSLDAGKIFLISNVGTADDIIVKDSTDTTTHVTLSAGESSFLVSSPNEWVAMRAWSDLDEFVASGTNHKRGLVPDPGAVAGATKFLREDGQWGEVFSVGIVDAFKFITDGTNTAEGSGADTLRLRSDGGTIDAVVTNNHATFGDTINFETIDAAIDHDALLNFVGDEHVAHSSISVLAGLGMGGGGTIDGNVTLDLDINALSTIVPVLADEFAIYDIDGVTIGKATGTALNAIYDHDALLNFVADEHIAHSGVSITGGVGTDGGGDLATGGAISLDFTNLSVQAIATADLLAFYDDDAATHSKITFANFNASLDHDSLLNHVANQHIDWTGATANFNTSGTITATGNINFGSPTNGLFYDAVNDRLAIGFEEFAMTIGGVSIPSKFAVHTDASEAGGEFHSHATGTGILDAAVIYGARSNGAEGAETIVINGNFLWSLAALGYDGGDYAQGARIDFIVDGVPGVGDMPTSLDFYTSPSGSETPVRNMRIRADGSIEVASTVDGRDIAADGVVLDAIINQTDEEIQDIIGAMVGGASVQTLIAVTYDDINGELDFVVDEANINHDALTNFVAGEHFLQSAIVEVSALDAGSITSNFGNIDIGTSTFDTTGAVNVGTFTSTGIDDNATQEMMQLGDFASTCGAAGNDFVWSRAVQDRYLAFAGGSSNNDGAGVRMHGSTHATRANDLVFKAGTTEVAFWDASANTWKFESTDIKKTGSITPTTDGAETVGSTSLRYLSGHFDTLDVNGLSVTTGTGTPEAVVTAPVGSLFLRSDGGAGTTFYVKESGTGNTGWVGK